MLSSFYSGELGYGFSNISNEILDQVNAKYENMHYSDRVTASIKFGSSLKPKLTLLSFVREIRIWKWI